MTDHAHFARSASRRNRFVAVAIRGGETIHCWTYPGNVTSGVSSSSRSGFAFGLCSAVNSARARHYS